MDYVTLGKIVKDLKLEIIYKAKGMDKIKIKGSEVNRPGLQLAGYFDRFAYERLQIIGNVEWHYLNNLPKEVRYNRFKNMFAYPIPALIISRGLDIFQEIMDLAKKNNITILRTELPTTKFINILINYLDYMLAPEMTVHGVLIEVYGMGILIVGKSGVGKSETALELVKRGHRLVADDVVEIKRVEEGLRGEAPELIRHFMEIRGIGIIDIERLYGVGAVKEEEFIDLVIELEFWDENKEYDRIGLDEEYIDLLGIKIPKVLIPVRPGRNIAMIVEVAARNTRQKKLGYNAAEELNNKVKRQISERRENND
ncbi:Hpr(Ser) kinase/phosphatase [Keratinibaculum paraultunense]|uniref:HPr kinase/phosphorylase n=1 Tax=Keratinibaculum paraultunense TaxID=1278232 RepID=A0A4R3KUJ5_9FIRM|nr:HPr(Ser) kinase/phosphatase [Keratinibaculum paraultunense]QQY79110.1 HPr kinase/phosphorylase [Keratinibaculum paraultunense]TCS88493.1 Hpr(Ser) kinase/phosphatase [Keratinibaculum paraultunense]